MLHEAKAMMRVPKHSHVVNFLGIGQHNDYMHFCLLMEYCSNGQLKSYLSNNYTQLVDRIDRLFHWSEHIANAMDFLVQNDIIHVSIE